MIEFDHRAPDYAGVFKQRVAALKRLRDNPTKLPAIKAFYKEHPARFISDWGVTFDPRNLEINQPAVVPFILFPKQEEWVNWVIECWKNREPGLTEKSRDMGISWLSVATSATLCLFNRGMAIGFGSRKEEYVDKIGSPKSLFWKAREFIRHLPIEFRGEWNPAIHAPHMRIIFPLTGSVISGEAGDNIGRGDRASIYFVDEAAYLEHPDMVEASLSQTTNCRQDVSTPRGMANPFATKRFSGKVKVFTFHWRDDPRKDDAWYARQLIKTPDPVVIAQEVDLNYSASIEGVLIPNAWVMSAVNAHAKLNIEPSGARTGALDVADEGKDMNAFIGGQGLLASVLDEWSGKGDDIFKTTQRAFFLCDQHEIRSFRYDSDGLGAGVRGDARVINDLRKANQLQVTPFRGSAGVENPEREDVPERKNKDFFLNHKSQAWWSTRSRFQHTWRALNGEEFDADKLIAIDPNIPLLSRLTVELSQPTFAINNSGKVGINKTPDGMKSPNLADAFMIWSSSTKRKPMTINNAVLEMV